MFITLFILAIISLVTIVLIAVCLSIERAFGHDLKTLGAWLVALQIVLIVTFSILCIVLFAQQV